MQSYIVGTGTWTGNVNQQKAVIPAGTQTGDLILVFWFRSGGTTNAGNEDNGFATLDSGSGTNLGMRCLYKIAADNSEAGTTVNVCHFSSGSDNAVSICVVIRGFTGTPVSSVMPLQHQQQL